MGLKLLNAESLQEGYNGEKEDMGMEIKGNWGGKRKGAGAKRILPVGARRRALSMTDREYEKVKKFLEELRRNKSEL